MGWDESKVPNSEIKKLASTNKENVFGEENSKKQFYSWVRWFMTIIVEKKKVEDSKFTAVLGYILGDPVSKQKS